MYYLQSLNESLKLQCSACEGYVCDVLAARNIYKIRYNSFDLSSEFTACPFGLAVG